MSSASEVVSTRPKDRRGSSRAAEIVINPTGRHVYASNRGDDTLAVFARDPGSGTLTLEQTVSSGGDIPRGFALSPDGAWLVCANQRAGNVVVFRVDPESGRLTPAGRPIPVPNPTCVLFYN